MKETPKAAAAFIAYCELGQGRSLAKLAKQWGKNKSYVGQLERWSSENSWQERVKDYERELAAERRRKHDADIEEMNARHAAVGMEQQEKVLRQIGKLMSIGEFGPYASVQLLKLATDLERVARGAPTERSELTGKDGAPLIETPAAAQIVIFIPDNGRDGYAGERVATNDGSEQTA